MPEDRKRSEAPTVNQRIVKIVKVPCDESKPIKEISISVDEGRSGDQLPSRLQVYFGQGKVRVDDVKDVASKQFSNQDINISQNTLDKLSDMGSVETFPLAQPNEHNNNCKVSFYLDEVGQLKKLSPNQRASRFAELCGFKDVPFVGDMFLGRVGPPPAGGSRGPQNLDFSLAEFNSDALWLKDVVKHNYEAGIATNKVAMESDLHSGEMSAEVEVAGAENVKWSETSDYLELSVELPEEIKTFTKKDIVVKIQSTQVSIKVRNTSAAGAGELLLLWEGALAGSVSVDDSTWCINKRTVEISLEKAGSSTGMWRKLVA